MAKTKEVSKVKVKKKKWFPLLAPEFLGEKEIGETHLSEAKKALGRKLQVNLKDLTGNLKDQNIYLSLKIKGLKKNNSLQTEVIGYHYLPLFLKKLARRGTSKIEDSFLLKTKEGQLVRLKPLAMTVFKISNSLKKVLRKELKEKLKEEVSKLKFNELIEYLIKYHLQTELKKKLNKICPLRGILIKQVELKEKT